ncbi:hypothetical protein CSIM01_08118 [Colletotrichum simmondsii]|uniref:Uncharacterized protein n=1 Tax=Colletotrichum simmondsii TaxID=703756 RepID=A0A135T870_9PEZI|nr:hypothetical protein CSIM01_08118 [Colletotrichum simmondsii]
MSCLSDVEENFDKALGLHYWKLYSKQSSDTEVFSANSSAREWRVSSSLADGFSRSSLIAKTDESYCWFNCHHCFDSNVKGIDVNRRALSGVSGKYSRVAPNPSSPTYQRLTSNVKQEKGADGENLLNVVTCQKGEGPAVVGRQEGARDAAVSTSDRMNAT